MTHLPELIKAYEAMTPWARALLRDVASDYAKKFPAPRKQPSLTLVQSSNVVAQAAPDLLDHTIDRGAPVLVGKPVDGQES